MGVRDTAQRQYIKLLNRAAQQLHGLPAAREGWIARFRNALGISGPQLARRAGVTKAAIYQAERNEKEGAISLKQLEKLADAMGGRLVYAIVPKEGRIEDVVSEQAHRKAEAIIRRASAHMALEKQALTSKQLNEEITRLADELMRDSPPDFWDDR